MQCPVKPFQKHTHTKFLKLSPVPCSKFASQGDFCSDSLDPFLTKGWDILYVCWFFSTFFVPKVWVTVGGWVGSNNSLLSRIRKWDIFKRLSYSLCTSNFFVTHIRKRGQSSALLYLFPWIRLGLSVQRQRWDGRKWPQVRTSAAVVTSSFSICPGISKWARALSSFSNRHECSCYKQNMGRTIFLYLVQSY